MLALVNVDNISGDLIPYLIEGILNLGAKNVNVVQALTKRGRLGHLWFIDTAEEHLDSIAEFLAREAGALGVRLLQSEHHKCAYEFEPVRLRFTDAANGQGPLEAIVNVKLALDERGEVTSARAEYRDLEALGARLHESERAVPLMELKATAELAALRRRRGAGCLPVEVVDADDSALGGLVGGPARVSPAAGLELAHEG